MLGKFYRWLWYHTQFWIGKGADRRPYTFIMRDWIYVHAVMFLAIVITWYGFLIALSIQHGTTATILACFSSLLLAHLVWGSNWIQGQQEEPCYDPDNKLMVYMRKIDRRRK